MLETHNRESAEASSPELARAPLPALLVSGAFPPAPRLRPLSCRVSVPSPPRPRPLPALISTPSWPGARGTLWGARAGVAAEHPSRCPGPRRWGGSAGSVARRPRRRERGAPGGATLPLGPPSAPGASSCRRVRPGPEVWWRSGEGAGLVQRSAPRRLGRPRRLCAGPAARTGPKFPPTAPGQGVPPALGWRPRHTGVNRAAAGRSS